MVSAFAARQRLVLAQAKVSAKSNEIVAIPALLDMMAIEGAVVTIDAMGCQRDIAARLIAKKADYILALKSNQGSLREDVETFANEQNSRDFVKFPDLLLTKPSTPITVASRHENRRSCPTSNGCMRGTLAASRSFIMVNSLREFREKVEHETRYYITSTTLPAERSGPTIRDH